MVLLQNEIEKVTSKFTNTITILYLNETKALREKIEQQNNEIKKLQSTCDDYATTVQQLKETISSLESNNKELTSQLQEKGALLESFDNFMVDIESDQEVSLEEVSFESCEDEPTYSKRQLVSSSSYSYYSSPALQTRSNSELLDQVVYIHVCLCFIKSFSINFCFLAH